ncbi:hypothetical protein TOPH_04657 [Tolypocladium ophioglossoides CBS 100239]|uniref:Alpha-1,2-mannosyltransferase n=1 Tax=Tolypocladium ophioglossoides (strain CBS 100239) TaxID=1163406 RepID=A0A0L0N9L6_TOLOC|nr:hypothetical protein TOPH_04657 [Tolypocladium ophioglossoides CBS 100239]
MIQFLQYFHLHEFKRAEPWIAVALIAVVIRALLRMRQTSPARKSRTKDAKITDRASSHTCEMPIPPPYPDWSLEATKPLPYRAFRYGPKYNVTMGLRSVPPIEWIELDNHYPKYHADKARRLLERSEKCVKTAPEAYPAAMELLQELTDYLPNRYPSLYKRTAVGIDNLWSGESLNITEVPLREDPMAMCARLPDGQYRLLAGAILLAGFWRLSDKFGMTLSNIHTSGDVPHFKEKLESGMMKFFQRLRCDTFYARNNYFIQVDDELPWSPSIGGEDEPVVSWGTAERHKAIDHHFFRAERQTLRRLPKTGAICFTIRTYFMPITEVAEEDCVPGRLASAVRSWDDWVGEYKGREKYGEILLEYLDRKHEEQLQRGLNVEKVENSKSYPW